MYCTRIATRNASRFCVRRVAVAKKALPYLKRSMATIPGGYGLSSIAEPNPTLFRHMERLGGSASTLQEEENDQDAQLRADVRTMGSLLGNIIKQHEGNEIFDKVESMRNLAKVRMSFRN